MNFVSLQTKWKFDRMVVTEVLCDKKKFLDLLLIGDEQESMIDRYLERGRLFVGLDKDCKAMAVCVVTDEGNDVFEVKNLAVKQCYRCQGYGRRMLEYVEYLLPGKILQLGTGETPSTLRFYYNLGFEYSHRITDFFTDNYDKTIVEEGVRLKDMVYLRKFLKRTEV